MLGQVFGVAVEGVHIEQTHPAGQIDQGFAAVLEQGADARQAVVGIEQGLVQTRLEHEGAHQLCQGRIVQGLQVLGVDPAQLGLVELACAAAQVVEVEPLQELGAAEDFVVAMAPAQAGQVVDHRSEEHTSELQSPCNIVCRLLLDKKKTSTR